MSMCMFIDKNKQQRNKQCTNPVSAVIAFTSFSLSLSLSSYSSETGDTEPEVAVDVQDYEEGTCSSTENCQDTSAPIETLSARI